MSKAVGAERFLALEGVRGLAAVMVVFHHFILAFYPAILFGPTQVQHMRLEDNIFNSIFVLPFAGTLAVAIFFVLSGFVLSVGFFQTGVDAIVKKLAVKRYLRLMIPALAITLICFVIIKLGGAQLVSSIGAITQSIWLIDEWSFTPTLVHAIQSGTMGIFMVEGSLYNNVLWTMMIEFLGSFFIFIFLLLVGKSPNRWMAYILAGILTFNSWYLAFVIGMLLADLYTAGWLKRLMNSRILLVFGLLAILVLGAYPQASADLTMYRAANEYFLSLGLNVRVLALTVAATLIVLIVLTSRAVASFLEKPKVSVLGKYTFALYLVHIPVMYTVGFASFLWLHPLIGYNFSVIASFAIMLPVLVIATVLFERYIDAPAVVLSNKFAALQLGDVRYVRPRKVIQKFAYLIFGKPKDPQQLKAEELPIE